MHRFILKILAILIVNFLVVPAYAQEKSYRSVEALKSLGVHSCVNALSKTIKYLYEEDKYAYLNTWNQKDPDKHMTFTLTSMSYSDGKSFATIAASPTPAGTCDISFSWIFNSTESCAKLRDTTFKGWKYYGELAGASMYEDPTSETVTITLTSRESGCLIAKTGMFFFAADKRK